MADKISKGRHGCPFGERSPRARLTALDVENIRNDPRGVNEIARHYRIDNGQISRIRSGKVRVRG